ncbi:hypothetical protein Sjap_015150 [Stephania japonica]|uniref:Reverse transcriptase n=1 Tax=Stephania japonica TaxID=461633 RepID=A0AAP0IIP5_9MAGN
MKGERNEMMALKLNMSKAYDIVEWAFLEVVMRRMGFPPKRIALVIECVSIVSIVSFTPRYPRVSHLLFADDNIFFLGATSEDRRNLKDILSIYERASGSN